MHNRRVRIGAFLLLIMAAPLVAQSSFDFTGYAAGRSVMSSGRESWLEGGLGRLEGGGDNHDLFGVAQMGMTWRPSPLFELHASGAARYDPAGYGGDAFGLVEAHATLRFEFANEAIQLRAGQFFLPTSRENIDPLWTSPYSVGFSTLNSWMAEEVRPLGADLQWRHTTARNHSITVAATAFQGNDSMGALLAWRGWSAGSRLSMYGEVLPLPPQEPLRTFFAEQRDDGTLPFGPDLDGRTGYAARLRYSLPTHALVQYTWLDNRGDRDLYRGEYAWATAFHHLGAEVGDPENFLVAAEAVKGSTGMGRGAAFVQADFYNAYILLSEKAGRNRWTARYEIFNVEEKDFSPAGSNDDSGRAWTLAWLFDVTTSIRAGLELTQITGNRVALQEEGLEPSFDGRNVLVEVRYRF